jgi:autotransporter-associated beta strand protein
MKSSRAASVSRSTFFSLALVATATLAFGDPPVLRWNGPSGGLWDAATANWLDAGDNAVVWQPGATAAFAGSGGIVNVAADVAVSNIIFTGNGYTLLGAGRVAGEGAISTDAGTTNCIAAEILTAAGLSKTGAGALALARCAGPLAVAEGALLVSGSLFADAKITVASGASLVTLGEPDTGANLLLNPGFEDPALSNGAWAYRDIPSWVRTANSANVGMKNTAAAGEWALLGASPEGVQMAIVQGGGALSQTVTLPADGLYAIAFSYMMRNQIPARTNQVYVSLGDRTVAAFVNRSPQTVPGRFVSGALWLPAGTHTLTVAGEAAHGWADCTTLIDAACFAPPAATQPCRAFGGDAILALVTGASAVLSHGGTLKAALVSVNGTAVDGGFTYDASHVSGIFSGSGSLEAQPPENVFTQTASGDWSASSTWQNGTAPAAGGGSSLLLRLTADSTNDRAGGFLVRRLQLLGAAGGVLGGNALALAGTVSQPSVGDWTVSAPVKAVSAFTVDNTGNLTFSQPIGITNSGLFVKSGSGTLTLAAFTNGFGTAYLYGGTVAIPALPAAPANWELYSSANCPVALRFTAPGTVARRINLYGSGLPTVAVAAGGGTVTLSDWTVAFGANAAFDVADGDTLSLRQLVRSRLDNGMASAPSLLKTGPGTLEIRSAGADTDKNRAYPGSTTLRNGTLSLSDDDWGTLSGWTNPFNGRTYTATGGSLGYSPFTAAVAIGDNGTAASDNLALLANGTGRYIGHNLEIFNRGNAVALGMTTGTAYYAGTITLHRDIALAGAANAVLSLGPIIQAGDFSGTGALALSGLAGLRFEGSVPASLKLDMGGRLLSFGTRTVASPSVSALSLGSASTAATLEVDFGAGTNDTLVVTAEDGLILSNTVVNLFYSGAGQPFAEPGVYTLFTYSGTLGGDVALLSAGNPQSGASYVFANDTDNRRVTLTISGTSGGVGAVWKYPASGNWGTGSNWDGGLVPDGAGVVPLFGLAITSAATVDVGSGRTAGGLLFNNGTYGYTLAGSGLTLATNGATPLVSVTAGSHTINTTLSGGDGLNVSAAAGATLILGSDAALDTGMTLTQGTVELRGNATVSGTTALGASTVLRAAAANGALASLTGNASSAVEFAGATPKLTVSPVSPVTFAGQLKADATALLVKSGASTFALNNPSTVYSGRTEVAAGTLALHAVPLAGPVAVGPSGTLSVEQATTNGLMGSYFNVTPNTNNFWTLAGMEAHFASLRPDLSSPSGLAGANVDFGSSGALFPQPYGAGGSRTTNFEAAFRGMITVPESGSYIFGVQGDDGFLLAINGQTVLNRNAYSGSRLDGTIRLDAGRYDIVLGYFQISGGYGLQLYVKTPSSPSAYILVPNAWLAPYSSSAALSGSGTLACAASNAQFRVSQSSSSSFSGPLTGAAGSLLAKEGSGMLSVEGAGSTDNAFAGMIDVQKGILRFGGRNRIGDTSPVRVQSGATLAFVDQETIGALSGNGSLLLGGYVYLTPFSGDSDCDISTAKTYTHLVDFPTGSAAAVINGVSFGNTGAWAFSGTVPTGAWNAAPDDTTRAGIDSLLWDFTYNSTNYSLTLSGLTPNTAYETRLYFRNFANNPRYMTLTFSAGAKTVGSLYFNPDAAGMTRCWVGCRYTSDATGTLTIRILSTDSTNTPHLYGFSNEQVAGSAGAEQLTLAPAAGQTGRFTGSLSGTGQLIKDGAGTQRFGGASALAAPLEVRAGTAVLDPGAALPAGASVAAGATLKVPLGNITLGALTGQGTFALTGAADYAVTNGPRFVKITGDADCGVSADKTYTHLIDFGSSTALAVVNGVGFNKERTVSGPAFGCSWVNASATSPHPGGNTGNIGVPSNQSIYNLLNDFCYGGPYGPAVMTLTGLTTGKTYEVRFYHRKWEATKARDTTFTFDPDGSGPVSDAVSFNPDSPAGAANYNDNYLAYRYLAQTNQLAVTITCPSPDKYHLYGLSNEEVPGAINGLATLDIAADCVFDGALTGSGPFAKTGAGALAVTGASTATGAVAVIAGAFGAANGGTATLGPVAVAPGATLFGHGRVGGAVSVASNAWLMAGTASACGTLQVGGSLTLAQGARIAWRFDTAVADAFTVSGLLTFPTNGVVQAQALTAGAKPPAKTALFASAQPINGPVNLTGWSVDGVENCSLVYSDDRTIIYLRSPRGTMILIR